jgi:hypothetical protein
LKDSNQTLRALYRELEKPGKHPLKDAHAALDDAVRQAYGFTAKDDMLKSVLDLNRQVGDLEDQGDAVAGPGLPRTAGESFVSNDFYALSGASEIVQSAGVQRS